jgi:hypothetical protein
MNMIASPREGLKKKRAALSGAARDDVWPSRAELRMTD